MSRRSAISTGVADAGIASLATFLGGLYAAATLTESELGVYGLFFSGFVLAGVVPAQLIFTPIEVRLNTEYETVQMKSLPRSTILGGLPALLASLLVVAFVIAVAGGENDLLFAVGATTVVASTLSPIQDHVRRVLHQASRSSWALMTSVCQFGTILVAIVVMNLLGVEAHWIPMGALGIANAASLAVGLCLARRAAAADATPPMQLRESTRVGRWLMYATLAQSGALFLALLLIQRVSGSSEVGFYEASRQISQPVWVLGTGLMAVMRPPVMRAAESRVASLARRTKRQFFGLLAAAAGGWILVAGLNWSLNPVRFVLDEVRPEIADKAFAISGLVAGITLGAALWSMTLILAAELTAGDRERGVFKAHLAGSVLMLIIVAGLAGTLGAWALPIGVVAQSALAAYIYRTEVRALYAKPERGDVVAPNPTLQTRRPVRDTVGASVASGTSHDGMEGSETGEGSTGARRKLRVVRDPVDAEPESLTGT